MSPYRPAIERAAAAVKIAPDLVEALTVVESGGNPFAWNPEPRYRWLWNVKTRAPFRAVTPGELIAKMPPPDFPCLAGDPDQEWWAQQASWGLCQVMGAVARERGFRAHYLTALVDVTTNLSIGCAHLASLLVWAQGDVAQALAAWNGGKAQNDKPPFRNAKYAEKVLHAMEQLR
jgi:soluble lytic murein transglycosylase-like protein